MNETLLEWRTELIKEAISIGCRVDRESIWYRDMQLYFSELEKQYLTKSPKEAIITYLKEKKQEKQGIIANFVEELSTINDMLFMLGEKV
ncbi:MAG: hypothetical protein QXF82_10110 [Nitrososphaeria archaeon]